VLENTAISIKDTRYLKDLKSFSAIKKTNNKATLNGQHKKSNAAFQLHCFDNFAPSDNVK